MTEKPLHVQVAEAVGWTKLVGIPAPPFGVAWVGDPPPIVLVGRPSPTQGPTTPPRYDTDWSATGPLIEKSRISLRYWIDRWEAGHSYYQKDSEQKKDRIDAWDHQGTSRHSPLLAVCNLILLLKETGKL